MPQLKITWHTQADDLVCPICKPLHMQEWVFHTDKEPFPKVLAHPLQGMVWDTIQDHSLAHGDGVFRCRCYLRWDMTDLDLKQAISKVQERVEELKNKIQEKSL
jgi:hypothetical protein